MPYYLNEYKNQRETWNGTHKIIMRIKRRTKEKTFRRNPAAAPSLNNRH